MKNRGSIIIDTIVFVGLMIIIAWGLKFIINRDFSVETPRIIAESKNIAPVTIDTDETTPVATSSPALAIATTTATTTKTTATTTVVKAPTKPTPPAAEVSDSLTVTLTDKGFSPTTLTIKKGQTVTFLNKSSEKMWVSANPFPSAADFPAFNEKSGTASGTSWDFTFDKTGVWFYHNHYHPAQGAKIIVNAK